MDIQDWLKVNKDRIIKIIELEDVLSKSDPCEQPYKSQYAARDILQSCITELDELMNKDKKNLDYISYLVYFNLCYRLANNFITSEERYSGEEIIFSLCNKIEQIDYLNSFLRKLNKKYTTKAHIDTSMIHNESSTNIESLEIENKDNQIWLHWLVGIILRIYNACGLLWAGRIINQIQFDSSQPDDQAYDNSVKFLSRSKRIYKLYKLQKKKDDKTSIELHTEITLNYDPPECFDSLLLNMFQYETPYLTNECYLMEGVDKIEALKFDLFESDYTTTLFLLAQTFGKMSAIKPMKHKSAKYCYWTLYRQLNALKYDPVEWGLNAATLSQYYVLEGVFTRARHCISAAETIFKEAMCRPTPGPKEEHKMKKDNIKSADRKDNTLGDTLVTNKDLIISPDEQSSVSEACGDCNEPTNNKSTLDQLELDQSPKTSDSSNAKDVTQLLCGVSSCENPQKTEKMKPRKLLPDPMSESRLWDDDVYEEKRVQGVADVERCWVSYGLRLLELSHERTMPDYTGPTEQEKFLIECRLPDFNLELAAVEREITHEWVYSFEEAREIFLFVQKKIKAACQYYKLDFRCSDAIELICDHSKAFKALSNFEVNTERKCIMHKKRVDMLTELLKTLNQKYYQIPCRKIMLELGEIYSTMINLKLSLLEITTGSNDSIKLPENAKGIVKKVRLLGLKGLGVYQDFLESYRNSNGVIPEIFTEDDIRPVLIAHFYMARMFSKILEPEPKARLKNLVKSLEHYQYIVDYCNKHDNAAKQMSSEFESCKDMAILLPRKIDKLRAEC